MAAHAGGRHGPFFIPLRAGVAPAPARPYRQIVR